MASTREQFIEAACDLIDAQGYRATGLNQIIDESGAPRGSLYYHFPDGKDGLTEEAIRRTAQVVEDRIRRSLADIVEPAEAVRAFILTIARHAEGSGYRAGGPVTTVALETATSNERLNLACREAYLGWQAAFAAKLEESGFTNERAQELALLITVSIEGATILSRTLHSPAPFERIADELERLLKVETALE